MGIRICGVKEITCHIRDKPIGFCVVYDTLYLPHSTTIIRSPYDMCHC